MSLRCGNEAEDSANFDAEGVDGFAQEASRTGTRLSVLTGVDAEFLHA
jgi:hypothetical protein